MAKFSLKLTKRYLRDLKLARKRGMDESLLNEIIGKLLVLHTHASVQCF